MRVGATIFNQNYSDWDRYEAEEQGKPVAKRPARSDRAIFNEEIDIARIADDSGFDSVWTIEHHFTPYTMVTNPLQYLTYIAGITKRVDLGTMVTVLPWHNPVRVAEDVNMLDAFLGPDRNVICGVGRGLARREYAGMGIDQNEARARFDESLQVLTQLLATGQCEFDGEFYKVHGLRLRPQLEHDLSVNLWCAGGTEQTVQIIAKHGVRPLTIPTTSLDLALVNMRHYAELRRDAGYPPSHTKLALWTYVAETTSEAQAAAERHMVEYANSALRHYQLPARICGASRATRRTARNRTRCAKMPHRSRAASTITILGARRRRRLRERPSSLTPSALTRSCSSSSTAPCPWPRRKRACASLPRR